MSSERAYGYFDAQQHEYVITEPLTPLPWINYLGSKALYSIISNTGGGYSFYRDAKLRRLTRYRYDSVPLDSVGKYLYIADGDCTWNPGFRPTRTSLDQYQCRHGLGYTRFRSAKNRSAREPTRVRCGRVRRLKHARVGEAHPTIRALIAHQLRVHTSRCAFFIADKIADALHDGAVGFLILRDAHITTRIAVEHDHRARIDRVCK